jgi:hypothetical protein
MLILATWWLARKGKPENTDVPSATSDDGSN